MAHIALLTDFGMGDGYVGIMKGAIAGIAPGVQCLDLSHDIPPQDLWAGRFCLRNAAPYFPPGTIFLCVIDPGVGSDRRGIAVQFPQGQILVAPDNGLVSALLDIWGAIAAVDLSNPHYWRTSQRDKISSTFHGRDIFAPVAAHLAQGVPLENLGQSIPINELKTLPLPTFQRDGDRLSGQIQHIDHFGNLISNIPNHVCPSNATIHLGDRPIPLVRTYSDVPPQTPCALPGSHGWLEISINQGNAQRILHSNRGDEISLKISLKIPPETP